MSFASLEFFLFLPAVFLLYYWRASQTWQNALLVIASYLFYSAWDYRFCGLMLASSLIDYAAGWALLRAKSIRLRKAILVLSLGSNLALLGFFKYFGFFTDSLSLFLSTVGLETNLHTLQVILPVGISFYTFQTMSYTIDIYRGRFRPEGGLVQYMAFVSFFPQLVAGPIERAAHLLPQFSVRRTFQTSAGAEGCRLILYGLFCKMVLADNLGALVDRIYASPNLAQPGELVLATLAFGFQIYFDFSAYSIIAAGTALLFGIKLMRNFDYPYFSQTIGEFWRRWHISLSSWFRDYVYIPLGGNRGTREITCRNLFLTFLLSGLWHGAAWHFVAWGMLHGIYISASFYWDDWKRRKGKGPPLPGGGQAMSLFRILRTFFLVMAGWVLFRASSLDEAFAIYHRMAAGLISAGFFSPMAHLIRMEWTVFLLLGIILILEWWKRNCWIPLPLPAGSRLARWMIYTTVFWVILILGTKRTSEFIYFQF